MLYQYYTAARVLFGVKFSGYFSLFCLDYLVIGLLQESTHVFFLSRVRLSFLV